MEQTQAEVVERRIELDAAPEDVWAAVCEPTSWLADEGELDLRPGGEGRLVDDGVARQVAVETVEDGRRLVFRWWEEDGGDAGGSRVEVTVVPLAGPTVVMVREVRLTAPVQASATSRRARASAALRWEVRLACLAFVRAPALV